MPKKGKRCIKVAVSLDSFSQFGDMNLRVVATVSISSTATTTEPRKGHLIFVKNVNEFVLL